MAVITLAGGCFWGMEALYRRLPGVENVTAGYANGKSAELAYYEAVCTGATDFREAVRVEYDPDTISLEQLLFCFFAVIDPEIPNRQGMDIGSQYQTGIYWEQETDEAVVRAVCAMEAAAVPFFAVEMKPLENFFPAEEYHQRYLEKHPRGYCHISLRRMAALERYPFSKTAYTHRAKDLLNRFLEEEEADA